MYNCLIKILEENKNKVIGIVSHATAISYLLNRWCKVEIENDKLNYKYKDVEIINGYINYCDTFKLNFDENNFLINIEKI